MAGAADTEPAAIFEATVAALQRHGLAPTPRHYAVWYEIISGGNSALAGAMEAAMARGRAIDPLLMAELYEEFILGEVARAAMREAGVALHEAAGQMIEAGHDATHYGHTLHEAAGVMGQEPAAMTGLLARLLEATSTLSVKSLSLGKQLQTSGRRIDELERELATAHREALTDPLTGLLNRRAFDEAARDLAQQATALGHPLSVLMVDIDHFKRVNDQWGHAVGDAVIRLVGATLAQTCRIPAQAARYGGEEFAVLMPGTPLAAAAALAERIRATLAARRISLRASAEPLGIITVSVGTTQFAAGEEVRQWLGRADAALYRAKRDGRNQVVALAEATA